MDGTLGVSQALTKPHNGGGKRSGGLVVFFSFFWGGGGAGGYTKKCLHLYINSIAGFDKVQGLLLF